MSDNTKSLLFAFLSGISMAAFATAGEWMGGFNEWIFNVLGASVIGFSGAGLLIGFRSFQRSPSLKNAFGMGLNFIVLAFFVAFLWLLARAIGRFQ